MIDSDLKPYLIEVNHAPSLATDSAFDLTVKKKLVSDTIRILNLSLKRKWNYINNSKEQFQKRILTGKMQKLTPDEKESKREEIDNQRNIVEQKLLGGYRRIFPCEDLTWCRRISMIRCSKYRRSSMSTLTRVRRETISGR